MRYITEERRLMTEKIERSESIRGQQINEERDHERKFMMQQYEQQISALREQLGLKETEAAQLREQFEIMDN
jgi:hypothetical protein